jgi:hypothetical protein
MKYLIRLPICENPEKLAAQITERKTKSYGKRPKGGVEQPTYLVVSHARVQPYQTVFDPIVFADELLGGVTHEDAVTPSWTSCLHVTPSVQDFLLKRVRRRERYGVLGQVLVKSFQFLIERFQLQQK